MPGVFAEHCAHDKHEQAVKVQYDMVYGVVVRKERLVAPTDQENADEVEYIGVDEHFLRSYFVEQGKYPSAGQYQEHVGEQKPDLTIPCGAECSDVFYHPLPVFRVRGWGKAMGDGQKDKQCEPV